jgi:hypothetical protein
MQKFLPPGAAGIMAKKPRKALHTKCTALSY